MGCGNREYAVVSWVQAAPTSAARLVQGYSGYSMCWRTVPCCPLTIAVHTAVPLRRPTGRVHACSIPCGGADVWRGSYFEKPRWICDRNRLVPTAPPHGRGSSTACCGSSIVTATVSGGFLPQGRDARPNAHSPSRAAEHAVAPAREEQQSRAHERRRHRSAHGLGR